MALIKIGVPFDIAHAMDLTEGTAYQIIAGQIEGGVFDWSRMAWKQ